MWLKVLVPIVLKFQWHQTFLPQLWTANLNSSKFCFSGILVHCCNIFLLPYCFCCSTSRFQRCHRWGLSVLVRCSSCRRGKFLNLFHWCLKNQIIMRFVDQFWYIRKMEVVIIEKIILLVSAYTLSRPCNSWVNFKKPMQKRYINKTNSNIKILIKIGKIFHYAEFERGHVECATHIRLDLHTSNVLCILIQIVGHWPQNRKKYSGLQTSVSS